VSRENPENFSHTHSDSGTRAKANPERNGKAGMPELAAKLEELGWKVHRGHSSLVCTPNPLVGRSELERILNNPAVSLFIRRFDCEADNRPADPGFLGSSCDPALLSSVRAHLETLPCDCSATATEIALALYGPTHSLDQIMEVLRASEFLASMRVLVRGVDGFGYQFSCRAWLPVAEGTEPTISNLWRTA
jgi:hypothetical protein